jgi:hypothetical protein
MSAGNWRDFFVLLNQTDHYRTELQLTGDVAQMGYLPIFL